MFSSPDSILRELSLGRGEEGTVDTRCGEPGIGVEELAVCVRLP
jgi:hypothetical protein